jgi:O-antigen/teichoic acid export membrane protein
MSNPIKQLAGQTAVYGLSSIVARLINYLLVPLYTYKLSPAQYGVVTEIYSYISFLIIFLTYGMETALFRFTEKTENKNLVYSTTLVSIIVSSAVFLVLALIGANSLSELIRHPGNYQYIVWMALILVFDAVSSIPFARLRIRNQAMRFAGIKMMGILVNVAVNLFLILLCPYLYKKGIAVSFISYFYTGELSVNYIFFSNAISSGLQVLLLLPEILGIRLQFDKALFRRMLVYALPLLVFGFAGVINETLDRVLIKYLLPADISMTQLGIYGACYKIAILMTIFIQAYRYAAEPFFFSQAKNKDARLLYAEAMNYFVIIVAFIFLATMMYMDIIIFFIGSDFREGAHVIPILLMANLFLGVYYNLSIWYKLTDRTLFGAWLSIFGALITIVLNILWIPVFGYTGSAWATLLCYFSMMVVSYFVGQRYFPVSYRIDKFMLYTGSAFLFYYLSTRLGIQKIPLKVFINTFILLSWVGIIAFSERKMLMKALQFIQNHHGSNGKTND